jgi:hypothetical protein
VFYADEETGEHILAGEQIDSLYNLVRMVVETNRKTGITQTFLMTFISSYDYLTSKKSLRKNSYLKRASDFDGTVLFHTLQREFVNGWKYKKGKIVHELVPDEAMGQAATTRSMPTTRVAGYDCFVTQHSWQEFTIEDDGGWLLIASTKPVIICFPHGGGNDSSGSGMIDSDGNPLLGGGGGGDGSAPNPDGVTGDSITNDPCISAQEISANTGLRSRADELLNKINTGTRVEEGWITANGVIHHVVGEEGEVGYPSSVLNSFNNTHSITERYHMHPKDQGPYPSWGDFTALADDYTKGRINEENFSYGVVSTFGCMSFVIADEAAFHAFMQKVDQGDEKLYNAYYAMNKNTVRHGDNPAISKFIQFLDQQSSGISVLYRFTQPNDVYFYQWSESNWSARGSDITTSGNTEYYNLIDFPCP